VLTLLAQSLTNPALPAVDQAIQSSPDSAVAGAVILGGYIAILIQTAIVLGGLAVLLYMFLGALGWITAGGDSGKIEKARDRMIQAIIGLAVLVSVVAIAVFIGPAFGLDLLTPTFINQLGSGTTGGSSGTGVGGGAGATLRNFTP